MDIPACARSFAVLFVVGALLSAAPPCAADDSDLADQWRAECNRVAAADQPDDYRLPPPQKVPDWLRTCMPEDMYYSAKADPHAPKAEWDRVRACATWRRDDNVLLMMYFNGFGVKRSYESAMHYACRLYHPKQVADPWARGIMNEVLLFADEDTPELDTCDGAFVQLQVNYCTSWREGGEERAYELKLDAIGRRLTPAQKAAFDALRAAAGGYAAACGEEEDELTRGGSGNPAFTIGARENASKRFLDDIVKSEGEDFPSATPEDFATSDRTLNQVYRDAMHAAAEPNADPLGGGETPETLRRAQRAWLKYRDAWVAFARLRYPKVPAYAWKARLTDQRLEWLTNPQ